MEWIVGIVFTAVIIWIAVVSNKQEQEIKAKQQKEINDLVTKMAQSGIYVNPYKSSAPAKRNGAYNGGFNGYCRNCGHQVYFSTYDVIPAPYPHGTCPYCNNWVAVF